VNFAFFELNQLNFESIILPGVIQQCQSTKQNVVGLTVQLSAALGIIDRCGLL